MTLINYNLSGVRIPGYGCDACGKQNVKLWRLNNVMMSDQTKLCIDDAARRVRVDASKIREPNVPRFLDPGHIMVPAVPSDLQGGKIDNYWRFEAVPRAGWEWWQGLPLR